jgi:predicted branched-subunit amino acid permease
MLVDQMVRGAPLIVAAVAVSVTAIRFLPLTVALMPIVRGPETRRWVEFAVAHFVAITMWLEAMRRLPSLPQPLRVPYYFGMATALVGVSALSTAAGFLMASSMTAAIAAALMLLSPLYFLIALIAASRAAPERLAIIAGLTLAPPLYLLTPQLDLLLAGLVGGTLAYGVDRVLRKRRATTQEPEI